MALQGKTSNYDTDVFTPLIDKIASLSGLKYGDDRHVDIAMRVIADHVRTIAFSIADSQLPGNAKAGYVIRRILRRAVRYAYSFLGQKQAFMYRLVDTLIDSMGEAYPELPAQRELIMRVIKEEEDAFLRTLENGIRMLDDAAAEARKAGSTVLPGEKAFTLYDTYGFPLDLTMLILKDYGMTVDQDGFDREMAAQKQRARAAASVEASDWVILADGEQQFTGYDETESQARILRYRHVKQKNREYYQLILDRTPFYAEMGGQIGDSGTLTDTATGEVIPVTDTRRENGVGVHIVAKLPSNPESIFRAAIDSDRRDAIAANHSATHLLHQALRQVLGTHVEQKGSFVSDKVLRFDFSHFQKVTPEELRQVEHIANANIRKAYALDEHRNVPIAEAREMGAMALFGEKYGENVRVIRFGDSIELCGGTHVRNTGNIGMVKIVSESSVAAGIRRIEAITGAEVEKAVDTAEDTLRHISAMFNNVPDLIGTLRRYIDENADLRHQVEQHFAERIEAMATQLLEKPDHNADGATVIGIRGMRLPELVKNLAFTIRVRSPKATIFVAATSDPAGKPLLTVAMTDDMVAAGYNASQLVREAAKNIKGGGGGQPGFAQAGGKDADGLEAAFRSIMTAIKA